MALLQTALAKLAFLLGVLLLGLVLVVSADGDGPAPAGTTSDGPPLRAPSPLEFINSLDIRNPAWNATLSTMFGAVSGDVNCQMKASCITGSYFRDLPYKSLVLVFLRSQVPTTWGFWYDAFDSSVEGRLRCESFPCGRPGGGHDPRPPMPSPVPAATPPPASPPSF